MEGTHDWRGFTASTPVVWAPCASRWIVTNGQEDPHPPSTGLRGEWQGRCHTRCNTGPAPPHTQSHPSTWYWAEVVAVAAEPIEIDDALTLL